METNARTAAARFFSVAAFAALSLASLAAHADEIEAAVPAPAPAPHGPSAPLGAFPSHHFQLAPHLPSSQVAVHFGMLQPIVLHGLNAAVDYRFDRFILTYSHGVGLDVDPFRTASDKTNGVHVKEPWTTGGGVGVVLIDELWVLADLKVHHFEAETSVQEASYNTVTVGGEVGYRFFVWKGLHVAPVLRFWPNVADTAPTNGVRLHTDANHVVTHDPMKQGQGGFFANLLVGWAFDLCPPKQ